MTTRPHPAPASTDAGLAAPWVVVLGMHRSGTSALTGALAGLGMTLPPEGDLIVGQPDNPAHYESAALIEINDRLLEALAGRWDRPPDLEPGWETSAPATDLDAEGRAVAGRIFPGTGPNVWKDPRVCLLLPWWRRLLTGPVAAVFVWRQPQDVAASLHRRDGSTLAHGVALWEEYNRRALAAAEGLPTFVLSAEALMTDPATCCSALAGWLDGLGVAPSRGWDWDRAAAVIQPELVHPGPELDWLGEAQVALAQRLRSLEGPHDALPAVELGPRSVWATEVLDRLRDPHQLWLRNKELSEGLNLVTAAHDQLITTSRAVERDHQELLEQHHLQAQHVAAVEAERDRLRTDLAGATEAAAEWQRRAEAAEHDLDDVHASSSWKITAPLRAVGGGRRGRPA